MKLDTSNQFTYVTPFDNLIIDDNLLRVNVNKERIINDAKDYLCGKKTKEVTDFIKKFNSAKIRRGYGPNTTLETVAKKIVERDDVYVGQFMIDPKKQNGKNVGVEYLQTSYIQEQLSEFDDVRINRLPIKGDESERIMDGEIIKGVKKSQNTTKSLDCLVHNPKNFKIRCINKATTSLIEEINDKGGAQGNQLELSEKDVDKIDFNLHTNQNVYIIFILDGKYYKNNSYVLELIEKYKKNKNVYFTTSDGIKEVIRSVLYN